MKNPCLKYLTLIHLLVRKIAQKEGRYEGTYHTKLRLSLNLLYPSILSPSPTTTPSARSTTQAADFQKMPGIQTSTLSQSYPSSRQSTPGTETRAPKLLRPCLHPQGSTPSPIGSLAAAWPNLSTSCRHSRPPQSRYILWTYALAYSAKYLLSKLYDGLGEHASPSPQARQKTKLSANPFIAFLCCQTGSSASFMPFPAG